uniref:Uncharacterized protein n=1 Tax=Setaria digitata TaxID=48799 RepID=A0A915Q5H7_9BILA
MEQICIDKVILFQLSAIIVISLLQCSSKRPQVENKDKDEKKETAKNTHPAVVAEEQARDKHDKSSSPDEKNVAVPEQHNSPAEADKEKVRLKEMEEKRIEEIKPKIMKRNAKEERIAKGKETRGKGDYPTMDDVLSDWDSEKDGKKKDKEDGDQKSRLNTNLEDVEEVKKNEDQKAESGDGEKKGEKKEGEKKEVESKDKDDDGGKSSVKGSKRDSKRGSAKVDKTAGSQVPPLNPCSNFLQPLQDTPVPEKMLLQLFREASSCSVGEGDMLLSVHHVVIGSYQ